VLDALRRAEQTRPKERIRRLGRILVHVAEAGPKNGTDYVEEMMRIAGALADIEVAALGHITSGQSRLLGPRGRVSDNDARMRWVKLLPFPGGLLGGALLVFAFAWRQKA
jgi:hypothetical protein